jgi:uncharacterized protein (TIGR00730 family)
MGKTNSKYLKHAKWTVDRIETEVTRGLALLNKIDKPIVTVLGSHKPKTADENYKHAKKLGYVLGKKGYAIVTGGGPGVMDAANKGAALARSQSIGIRAALLRNEKIRNPRFTHKLSYHFLFVRRFILSLKSDALIFYPGGYGTLNEFFEYLVLMQLGMMDQVPMICVGKKYWSGLFKWLHAIPKKAGYFIDPNVDLKLVTFAETVEDVVKIIEESKVKEQSQKKKSK